MATPVMKASYMKDDLAAVARLPADVAARIRGACAEAVAAIEGATRADWLPVVVDVELTEAIWREAGETALLEQARLALRAAMDGPLLRPLASVTIRVFGPRPHAALRMVPRAWPMVFRDCGTLDYVVVDDHVGRLVLRDAAGPLLASAPWQRGTGATFDALAAVAGAVDARATAEVTAGSIEWSLRWR
jgi:hypothetical protein